MINHRLRKIFLMGTISVSILMSLAFFVNRSSLWKPSPRHRHSFDYNLEFSNQTRENAALVVLVRNNELNQLRETMLSMEDRFNRKFNYPWILLNDEPFDKKFIKLTESFASGPVHYGVLNQTMWGYPDWIDQEKARSSRVAMEEANVIYGGSESYRHMCRFQSGFFFRHPLLDDYDYYWRVEPHVRYFCDVDYDPFKVMRDRDLKYGWIISLREYEATIPTLWNTVKSFIAKYPEHVIPKDDPESLFNWISEDDGETYSLCHFWSNFEIGSLAWLRSKAYLDFFEHLDKSGGFFYERWGDAPVHSIAAALTLKKSEVHWFYDMGYMHEPFVHCPQDPSWLAEEKCSCDPDNSFDTHWHSCTPQYLKVTGTKRTDYLISD